MINIQNLDPNKIKANEKSYKNILIHHIGHMTVKNLRWIKINSLNLLCVIVSEIGAMKKAMEINIEKFS